MAEAVDGLSRGGAAWAADGKRTVPAATSKEEDKARISGKSPYVRARCGIRNSAAEITQADRKGGSSPRWGESKGGTLCLQRHPRDHQLLIVEVYVEEDRRPTFIGGNHVDIQKYLDAPKQEFEEKVVLNRSGQPEPGLRGTAGTLNFTLKWTGSYISFTALEARDLRLPNTPIRDVDSAPADRAIKNTLLLLLMYIACGILFFQGYMNSDLHAELNNIGLTEGDKELFLSGLTAGNGEWGALNTWVFIVTTFTTVGYGNQPSLTMLPPVCEFPSSRTSDDNANSFLLRKDMRNPDWMRSIGHAHKQLKSGIGVRDNNNDLEFEGLPKYCFEQPSDPTEAGVINDDCLAIAGQGDADNMHICYFKTKVCYASSNITLDTGQRWRRNYSSWSNAQISQLDLPGGLGKWDCVNQTARACWASKAKMCKIKLDIWRPREVKKNHAKKFTIAYIIIGIGVLGALAGACGDKVLAFLKKLFTTTESLLHTAAGATETMRKKFSSTQDELDELNRLESHVKTVVVTSICLAIIISFGAISYCYMEGLAPLDAVYFTVVTATTVGFGDYCPETDNAKYFTLFFVPFSVLTVGSAISYIAQVPLDNRKKEIEKYVLDKFVENLCDDDFDDIRRSAKLGTGQRIHQNDFLIAMLSRLDAVDTAQLEKCRKLFDILDRDNTGSLDHQDIELLIAEREMLAQTAEVEAAQVRKLDQSIVEASSDLNTNDTTMQPQYDSEAGTAVFANPLDD
jgi:hypothetical protein